MNVHVVPLRRLATGLDWFTYALPEGMSVQPGQLVSISLGRQEISGVVWQLTTESQPRLKFVRSAGPIMMTAWQRDVCTIIARQNFVSIGTIVRSVIPVLTKNITPPPSAEKVQPLPKNTRTPETWWYRDREAITNRIIDWLTTDTDKQSQKVLIVPTLEVGKKIAAQSGLPFISSALTAAEYRKTYFEVLAGRSRKVIGTLRGLTLPFPSPPAVLLDQEEHPGHKQILQHPRIDTSLVVNEALPDLIITSPAPSLRWYAGHRMTPPVEKLPRKLLSLEQPRKDFWLTPELIALFGQPPETPLALIAPHTQFASSRICRDCHYQVTCPHCHKILSQPQKSQTKIICPQCSTSTTLPTACPRCHGTNWRFRGIGESRLVEMIQDQWPSLRISTSWPPLPSANVWIGSYQALPHLNASRRWSTTIMVHGDALRAWPDYSAEERAWQFLARLQAQAPRVPVWVQSFTPSDPFWQLWLQTDEIRWYDREIALRKSLKLPPVLAQVILRHPGPLPATEGAIRNFQQAFPNNAVQALPKNSNKRSLRWLIHVSENLDVTKLAQVFPSPWQIDGSPRSWLD